MTVVPFPDEIHRIFLSRVASDPTFENYLVILDLCIRRGLDTDPLAQWWQSNEKNIRFENSELDYLLFLERIQLGHHPWKQEKFDRIERHHQYLKEQEEKQQDQGSSCKWAEDFAEKSIDSVAGYRDFAVRHPKYRSTPWVRDWLPIFGKIYGEVGPLEMIADHFNRLLHVSGFDAEQEDQHSTASLSLDELKLRLLDRPAWVDRNSDTHRHLLEIADWVSQNEHPDSKIIFNLILSSPEEEDSESISPQDLMAAASRCSHGLFAYLMSKELINMEVSDVLLSLLRLPLAVSPDPSGPPHLTPEFLFISEKFIHDVGVTYDRPLEARPAMISAWKLLFQRYRELRINDNSGKTFPESAMLFQIALASIWGEEECYRWKGSDYIEQTFSKSAPDVLCAINYFNEYYFPQLICLTWGLEEDASEFIIDDLQVFASVCFALIDQIEKEEWYSLACSLFSFYLIVAGMCARGNLDSFDGIPSIIIRLRGLPRFEYVERAIDVVCGLAHESGNGVTYTRLDQFRKSTDETIESFISDGESESCEFKSSLRVNLATGKPDSRMEHSVLKTIAGFLNKRGGNLLVGVADDQRIIGIEVDQFKTTDKWNLHLKNLVNRSMPGAMDHLSIRSVAISGKTVVLITCQRSEVPIYATNRETKREEFYVRRGSATDQLDMREAVDYIQRTFQHK